MPPGNDLLARATAETVARRSYGKLVALLASRTHDVAAAEDALAELSPPRLLTGRRRDFRAARRHG